MATRSVEDCLEAIYNLIRDKGYARICDISTVLGIRPPSVTEMVQRLEKESLIRYERYRQVELTSKGKRLARSVTHRHRILTEFLKMLGVSSRIAEIDACKMEHCLHPETMGKLSKLVEYYCKTGKLHDALKKS
ncbi:MAG: metal-dependent transcriptional regulator [Candidatus Bathyarchaeia archaeon]